MKNPCKKFGAGYRNREAQVCLCESAKVKLFCMTRPADNKKMLRISTFCLILKTKNMKSVKLLPRVIVLFLLSIVLSSNELPDFKKNYVQFDKNLFASRYELTNLEYREFINDLKSTGQSDKLAKCLYDSAKWETRFQSSFNEPLTKMYHWHPGYNNYPVVNITKEAADLYCEWLTDKYNLLSDRKYKKVLFRLPSELEWKKLASPLAGHNLPWYGNFPYESGSEKIAVANIKVRDYVSDKSNFNFDGAVVTSVVGKYKANNSGIYDVIGNVSEMTQSGVLKGGSWDSFLDECTVDKVQNYELPDPRVGFRVIMEVVEE
jgi:formylglycine-generating enzyme required for sulfatase activity